MLADLDDARESFRRRAWTDAYVRFSAVDDERPLEPEDLALCATAAYLIGRDAESAAGFERAHVAYLRCGKTAQAVRCVVWIVVPLLLRGEFARGGGWLARGQRLIDEGQLDCVEQGYLWLPLAIGHSEHGDFATAYATFDLITKIGTRFADLDLVALGRHGVGRSLIRLGETDEGLALLDEVMVGLTTGEVSAIPAGLIYCSLIEACQEIFDLTRAREWTAALADWCDAQPDLVPFRGQCLVHRSQVMQHRGAWLDAIQEVRRAAEWLSDPPGQPALGMAFYQLGEMHRLRGEFAAAELAYRSASRSGHSPQPGLAQLRLAQGRVDAAVAAIRRAEQETPDRPARAALLDAFVEIMLAGGDIDTARAAAAELSSIAADRDAPLLRAISAHAHGAVVLADGDAKAALDMFRAACTDWQKLDVPYGFARSRVLAGIARRQLGDHDTAQLELTNAREVFQRLGAAPDLARLDALIGRRPMTDVASGLSRRELEVLRLVATGKTNHVIAAELFLSDKTVARHVSNIFTKLGLSSRAAATAYAYERDLV
jgi:DNA-binding NarL/FixJ family response regulator